MPEQERDEAASESGHAVERAIHAVAAVFQNVQVAAQVLGLARERLERCEMARDLAHELTEVEARKDPDRWLVLDAVMRRQAAALLRPSCARIQEVES